jgi:hypothetical protein
MVVSVLRLGVVVVFAAFLAGCVQNHHRLTENLVRAGDKPPRILVLPVDAELSELSFGGMPTIRQDWTVAARENMNQALYAGLAEKKAQVTFHNGDVDDDDLAKILRLHAAVGRSIQIHQYEGPQKLPTKQGKFEWTLGPSISRLAEKTGADYVLFVYVRDSYSGPGRVAAQVIAAAVFGVPIQGGVQQGFASLVDLKSGEFVWYNRLQRTAGDLRTAEPAKETIAFLLESMPK